MDDQKKKKKIQSMYFKNDLYTENCRMNIGKRQPTPRRGGRTHRTER